jgi:hypothetical protein
MRDEVDVILMESVMLGAAAALDDLADELIELRRGWVSNSADPSAVEWLDSLISKSGWWRGRLVAASGSHSA